MSTARRLDRQVPERSGRQQEGRLPVRGTGDGGSGGPDGRALRGPAQGAAQSKITTNITSAETAATTGPPGATCSIPIPAEPVAKEVPRRLHSMRTALLSDFARCGLCLAQAPASREGRRRSAAGNGRRRVDGLPGHPVRRAAGRGPAMARAAARREVGRRASGRQIRDRPACRDGGPRRPGARRARTACT